ncbi:hypothetical protein SRM1_03232 [Pseudomonas fluorescens]|nr:hypothetical protein SRM1_03232 [Pseudomonas fluorescens]
MVGTGEDHPFHAMSARGFIDVEDAADVGAEYLFERPFNGHTAEMQDRVDAFDELVHSVFVGEIAQHDFFVIIHGRGERSDVRQTQHIGVRPQTFAQDFAQAAGSTGQQQAIEWGA